MVARMIGVRLRPSVDDATLTSKRLLLVGGSPGTGLIVARIIGVLLRPSFDAALICKRLLLVGGSPGTGLIVARMIGVPSRASSLTVDDPALSVQDACGLALPAQILRYINVGAFN
jgi:hypothetical protein